jgi:hypothetical protein
VPSSTGPGSANFQPELMTIHIASIYICFTRVHPRQADGVLQIGNHGFWATSHVMALRSPFTAILLAREAMNCQKPSASHSQSARKDLTTRRCSVHIPAAPCLGLSASCLNPSIPARIALRASSSAF